MKTEYIFEVDGKVVVKTDIDEVVEMLKGKPETKVTVRESAIAKRLRKHF
jgi:C-terminal processing protease CtpA/Prc